MPSQPAQRAPSADGLGGSSIFVPRSILLLIGILGAVSLGFGTKAAAGIIAPTMLALVLTIAVLLRFMDSFMIYTEPFVLTGGGPGNATTLLSIDLVKIALGQFDLGPAGAMSLIYFLIILLLSWMFYRVMTLGEAE